jgi:hypothetical protein
MNITKGNVQAKGHGSYGLPTRLVSHGNRIFLGRYVSTRGIGDFVGVGALDPGAVVGSDCEVVSSSAFEIRNCNCSRSSDIHCLGIIAARRAHIKHVAAWVRSGIARCRVIATGVGVAPGADLGLRLGCLASACDGRANRAETIIKKIAANRTAGTAIF